MESVGIREMKARLSSYLRRVRAGESVAVTDRGKVVAVLAPPGVHGDDADGVPALHERVRALGGTLATAHGGWRDVPAGCPEMRTIDAQALLNDLRGER